MLRESMMAQALPRPWVRGLGLFGLGLWGFMACTRELDEHPAPPATCTGEEGCVEPPDGVTSGGMAGAGGAAGSGGSGGDEDPATLDGTVRLITSPDLLSLDNLTQAVDVVTTGFDTPPQVLQTTGTDGSFRIENVARDSALQMLVGPSDNAGVDLFVPTLQSIDSLTGSTAELSVMSRSVFADLIENSFVDTPTVFDATQAAAVVTLVDERDVPISGATLVSNVGRGSVAYDEGFYYSDVLDQTGDRGTIVLLNVDAQVFPGKRLTINVQLADGQVQGAGFQVVRGAITLHTARLTVGP
jgi:hypothetical protein